MATQQQQRAVPRMENPFEGKATNAAKGDATKQKGNNNNKREKQKEETKISMSSDKDRKGTAGMVSESYGDAIDDSLPVFSIGATEETEFKEPEEDAASEDEDELDFATVAERNHELDSNTSNAGTDQETKEEEGRNQQSFDGVQRLKTELMEGEKRAAGVQQSQPGVIVLNEEEIQDALIQAAEDAMRYAYEETSRRQQAEESHYANFTQHQLAEILIRQKQSLLRLEDMDHRMESMESKMSKVMSLIQKQASFSVAAPKPLKTEEQPLKTEEQPASSTTSQQSSQSSESTASQSTEQVPPTSAAEDTSLPSVQMMLSQGTTQDDVATGAQAKNKQPRYPYAGPAPSTFAARIIDLLERIRYRIGVLSESASQYILDQAGQETWDDVGDSLLVKLRKAVARLVAGTVVRLRQARARYNAFLADGGIRRMYEGHEDEVLATALLSAVATTLLLLFRYRQRRRLDPSREINSAAMAATLAPITKVQVVQRVQPAKQKPVLLIT